MKTIIKLCDEIDARLGDDSLFTLMDTIFGEDPDDSYWNTKEAYEHLRKKHAASKKITTPENT